MFQDRSFGPDIHAYKTADESVVNSATLQADDDLTVSLKADRKYIFRLVLHGTQGAGLVNGNMSFSGPVNDYFFANIMMSTSTSAMARRGPLTALEQEQTLVFGSTSWLVIVEGAIEPTDDGDLVLNWATGAGANDTVTILRGSSFVVWRVA